MGVFPVCSVPVGSHQPGVAVGCELGLDFLLRSVGVSDWDLCARAVISEDAVGRSGCCSPLNAVRGPRGRDEKVGGCDLPPLRGTALPSLLGSLRVPSSFTIVAAASHVSDPPLTPGASPAARGPCPRVRSPGLGWSEGRAFPLGPPAGSALQCPRVCTPEVSPNVRSLPSPGPPLVIPPQLSVSCSPPRTQSRGLGPTLMTISWKTLCPKAVPSEKLGTRVPAPTEP